MHCWELGQGAGCSLSVLLGTAALTLLHTVTTDPIRCLWDLGGDPWGWVWGDTGLPGEVCAVFSSYCTAV